MHELDTATMACMSLHRLAPKNMFSRFTTRELAYNLRYSENKDAFHHYGQMITKIVLAAVALCSGIVSLVM